MGLGGGPCMCHATTWCLKSTSFDKFHEILTKFISGMIVSPSKANLLDFVKFYTRTLVPLRPHLAQVSPSQCALACFGLSASLLSLCFSREVLGVRLPSPSGQCCEADRPSIKPQVCLRGAVVLGGLQSANTTGRGGYRKLL